MDAERGAGLLHRLSSIAPGWDWDTPIDHPQARNDLVANDPETVPPPVKSYPSDLPRVPLPRELPRPDRSASEVLAGLPTEPEGPLDAAQLGRVLFLGAGVVRTGTRPGRTILFRAAWSNLKLPFRNRSAPIMISSSTALVPMIASN